MNYAYGVEFVEADPIALGTEEFEEVSAEDRMILRTQIAVDKSRYLGLHGRDSVFNEGQRTALRSVFDTRNDTITLLARSDPASADRLVDLYTKYHQAIATALPR